MSKLVPFTSVLIFGGAGFIGSNWAKFLLKNSDARIHIFDNLSRDGVSRNLQWLKEEAGDSARLKVTIGDVRDAALVKRAVQSASEIYHFAAQVAVTTSVADPRFDFDVNVGGTLNILEAARATGRHPFLLFTSTNKVYGKLASLCLEKRPRRYCVIGDPGVDESQPLDFYSPYGCSKGAADQYVRDYSRIFGMPTVVFRMSCVAGPHQCGNEDQGWVAHFLYSAMHGRPVTIYGDGRQVRDVLYVGDLVTAFDKVRSQLERTAGQVYNVGGGLSNSVSLLEITDDIERVAGARLGYEMEAARLGDQLYYVSDHSKLTRDTGWRPKVSLQSALQKMYSWSKEHCHEVGSMAAPIVTPKVQEVPEAVS